VNSGQFLLEATLRDSLPNGNGIDPEN